jgi:tetratricopeptide (TPR) repeat protein
VPTDYYRPIANAVGRLAPNTVGARRSIYDQARQLLFEEAQHARPPMAVSELFAEQRALEDAIERVESEFAVEEHPRRRVHPLQRQLQKDAEYPEEEAFHPRGAEEPVFVPEPGYDDPTGGDDLPEPEYVPEEHYDPEPQSQPDPRAHARAERLARQRPEQLDERRQLRGARRPSSRRAVSRKSSTHVVILIAVLSALFIAGAGAAYVTFFGWPSFRAAQQTKPVQPQKKQETPPPAKDDNAEKIRNLLDSASKALEGGNPTASIQYLTEAIVLSPKYDAAYTLRGHAYLQAGDPARAIEDFSEAIKLGSRDFYAFIGRAVAHRRQRDYPRAIADYNEAIKLRPDHAGAWNNRCFVNAIAGNLEMAIADCNESLRLLPNEPNALDSRALAYLKQGQWDAAIADYDAVLKVAPNTVSALYGRGFAKLKKGDRRGQADISTATAAASNIAQEFERYGVK